MEQEVPRWMPVNWVYEAADFPLTKDKKDLRLERALRLLHRLGAHEAQVEILDDGRIHFACSVHATSEQSAEFEGRALEESMRDALNSSMYDFVDEFPAEGSDLSAHEGAPDIDSLRAELDQLLQEKRRWFNIFPLPDREGLAIEIRDIGGDSFKEAQALGRALVEDIYETAYFTLTGHHYLHRGHTGPDELMP